MRQFAPLLSCLATLAFAAPMAAAMNPQTAAAAKPVQLEELRTLHVDSRGNVLRDETEFFATENENNGVVLGGTGCQQTSSHTNANFTGGEYIAQAGFVEDETAAVTYLVPPNQFPIRIDLLECIFVTSGAFTQTTTEWSVLVWEGTPATGTLVAEFSSDGVILPHIVLGPGTAGVNVQFSIDPSDPEQIIISNQGGSNMFSIGYRIDEHNSQTGNGCIFPPPENQNAFPTTDVGGLAQPSRNWIGAIDCGPAGCVPGGGFSTFANLIFLCRPTGDWVMRATWSSLNCQPGIGACCLPTGACSVESDVDCNALNGAFQGEGTDCVGIMCPEPTGACCFVQTGGCIDGLTQTQCGGANGIYAGNGTDCNTFVCFPIGACCLPDGSCLSDQSPADCDTAGGVFQGDGTICASTNCPIPMGACCFDSGFCLDLSESDCGMAAGTYRGDDTECATTGVCEDTNCGDCADANCDGSITVGDIGFFVAAVSGGEANWQAQFPGGTAPCDFLCANDANGDGNVTVGDIGFFVQAVTAGAPCGK